MIAPWITVDDLENPLSPYAEEAVEAATWILWSLSARKYSGVRTTTEVYCQLGLREIGREVTARTTVFTRGFQVYPDLRDGVLTNVLFGCCSTCGCPHLIRLRGGPVLSVESVYDGDRPVSLDDVAIYDYSYITVLPGRCWGSCDELEVTYTFGAPPPAAGRNAAKVLADQYILAMTGSDECTLPQRVTSVSRQGMSWTLLDPQDFLEKGRTGIYQVDLFLRTVNPSGALLRSRVFSPDLHRGKTYRWASSVLTPASGPQTAQHAAPVPQAAVMTAISTSPAPSRVVVLVSAGRPLRWVIPFLKDPENPPTIIVQPSGAQLPATTVVWRGGNYTLDLSAEQVGTFLSQGSTVMVSTQPDGSTQGAASYPVEWRAS